MKKPLALLLFFLSVGCSSLGEQQKYALDKKISKVTTDRFIDSNKRTLIVFNIYLDKELSKEIVLKELYYKNKVATIESKNEKMYFAKLNYQPIPSINMQREGKMEYGNSGLKLTPPPIVLEENQALISYSVGNNIKYYIIKDVKESTPHVAPGAIVE
ncbi:MAG: hypothetical protein H6584_02315 [Flavobacteriales bacterium]|nr:hypothetical protein [Flavobacteriales bacterium]